jgi:hypothetical protein
MRFLFGVSLLGAALPVCRVNPREQGTIAISGLFLWLNTLSLNESQA